MQPGLRPIPINGELLYKILNERRSDPSFLDEATDSFLQNNGGAPEIRAGDWLLGGRSNKCVRGALTSNWKEVSGIFIRRSLTCFHIPNPNITNSKYPMMNGQSWYLFDFHTEISIERCYRSAGLALRHWEAEGIHWAGGQDRAPGPGQRRQDHPAEEPGLWGREHHHTNTGGATRPDSHTHTSGAHDVMEVTHLITDCTELSAFKHPPFQECFKSLSMMCTLYFNMGLGCVLNYNCYLLLFAFLIYIFLNLKYSVIEHCLKHCTN